MGQGGEGNWRGVGVGLELRMSLDLGQDGNG